MRHESTYSWFLWKRKVSDVDIRFLHITDLPQCGFSSVYAVDEATATALTEAQNYSGFKGIVYSERLWIDCDTEEASLAVERGLRERGLGFEKWSTGNRGAHFGVKRTAAPSQLLPLQDKAWVKTRFPEADLKLYSHLHLFRLPGGTHEKSGKKKELIKTVEGEAITFDSQELQPNLEQYIRKTSDANGSVFDDHFIMSWSTPQVSGLRNKALSNVAYRLAQRGETPAFTLRWLEHINLLFSEPKSQEELQKIIRFAYQGRESE